MKFLLDTNLVIGLLVRNPLFVARIRNQGRLDFAVPSIVAHELYFGVYRSGNVGRNMAEFEALRIPVLDFDANDARRAGEVRAALAAVGTPIGPYDVLIAGQALARDLTLVTHNVREFSRVAGLRLEDWGR